MAKIKVAKSAGFCFGVDRAVKIVYSETELNEKVATLGPIIHNPNVVDDLAKKGVRIIDKVSDSYKGEKIIIRSHGVAKSVYDELAENNFDYTDATCPFVARIHKIVTEKTNDGYFIMIAGDENHPEVQGIIGHCRDNFQIFTDKYDFEKKIKKIYELLQKKVAIIAQTTYNNILWIDCITVAKKDYPNVEIYDTICNATSNRQAEAIELALESDIMIVVGGKHSSNTVKLKDICEKYTTTYQIETAEELDFIDFSPRVKVGITAGASTPAYIIKEVKTHMAEILNNFEEDINFEEALEQSFKKIHTGERVKGYVAAINNSEVIVDVGTKHTGYIPLSELTDNPNVKPADLVNVGDEIDLIVIKINDQEGIVTLSKKKVDAQVGFEKVIKAKEDESILEGVVTNAVKGGIIVLYEGVRIFIPASQSGVPRTENPDVLLKKNVKFVIIEVNEQRNRAVGSIKAVQKAAKEEAKAKFWETAEVGATYKGEVKSLTSYGAFVDLGGIDGMVHISELSWGRIKHPSEVVKIGDTLEVYVKDLNAEKNRISLGYKKTEDNPWEIFSNNYKVGDVTSAKIVSIMPFGAFAEICDGIDGLIHISQVADKRIDNVKDVLSIGQEIDVKITEIDLDKKRISISMRALLEEGNDTAEDAE